MSTTYFRTRRHVWSLLVLIAIGVATFLLVSNIFASDQTQNATIELDGNITNDTTGGTDWGPLGTTAGICRATGTLGTDGNGYIASDSLPANILVSTCDGDSYLSSTAVGDIGSGKAFGADTTYFSSNKDIQDIQTAIPGVSGVWGCTAINNPTPKDEILNSYAALGTLQNGPNAGDTSLFVGFERGKNTGTSFQGVWFLNNPIGCTSPGTGSSSFSCSNAPSGQGCHTPWTFDIPPGDLTGGTAPWTVTGKGDVLLLINFSGGGNDTSANMYLWAPAAVLALNRPQDAFPLMLLDGKSGMPFPNAVGSDCQDSLNVNPATAICATTNNPAWNPTTPTDGCIVTLWPPANQTSCATGATGKTTDTGGSAILDKLQFFEGTVDLNKIFGSVPCFSQALFEARSSDVPSATLKDYTLGSFNTCGKIIIHKETDPEDSSQPFGFTAASNPSAGSPVPTTFSLRDDGNNELGCDYSTATPTTADDCGTAGTTVFNNVPPGTYTFNENDPTTLTPPFDFKSLTCRVNSGLGSVTPDGTSTSSRTATVTINALGVVECLYENRQRGSIFFEKVDEGNSLLGGATFTVSPNPFGSGTLDVADNGTNDSNKTDGKFCLANVPFNASYSITEKTAPAGYEKDPNPQTVSVQTTVDCAARETAGGFPVFTNKLGAIVIKKTDEGTNPLAGACFTLTPNPKTGTGSLRVCDNPVASTAPADQQTDGANDTDTTVGTICITGARLNASGANYGVVESVTPAGYQPDTTTHHVTVSDSEPCPTTTATTTFVNKLGTIVIKKTDEANAPLGGACFTLTPNPKTGTGTLRVCDNPVSLTAPADQQTDGANDTDTTVGTTCITGARLNATGTDYSVVESVTPAGYEGDATTHHVTVSNANPCATTTATTTFINKLGTILIHKISAKTGNPEVAGACFTVMPGPDTTPPGSGSLVVCDKDATHAGANTTPDQDSRTGFICLTNVKLNSYTVSESTTPAGYKLQDITPNDGLDTSIGTITVNDHQSCADRATAGGDNVVTAVNVPLSEIEVTFKSLAGPGVTTATIDCQNHLDLLSLPFINGTIGDLINGAAADLAKVYGDNVTNPGLLPGTYICTVVIDP